MEYGKGIIIGLAFAGLCAGCAPTQAVHKIEAAPVGVVSKNVSTPKVKRVVTVPVETIHQGQPTTATCRLDSPYYTAKFTSPANLQLPDYGSKTPKLAIVCEGDGAKGEKEVQPQNTQSRNAATTGALFFGAIGAAVAAASVQGNEGDYFYNRIVIRLK
jgi:hypothetical protein